jgi:hypothetical protein
MFYSCFALLIAACESNQIDPTPKIEHFVLNKVLDHLPFE